MFTEAAIGVRCRFPTAVSRERLRRALAAVLVRRDVGRTNTVIDREPPVPATRADRDGALGVDYQLNPARA